MAQTKRVANLVNVGLEAVAAQAGAVCGQPGGRYVDCGCGDNVTGPRGGRKGIGLIVIEYDLSAARHFGKDDAGGIGPQPQRLTRQGLAIGGQAGQIDSDRISGTDRKVAGGTAPISVGQLEGDLVVGKQGQRWGDYRRDPVRSGSGIRIGADVEVIGSRIAGGEDDLRIGADRIVIIAQQRAGVVAQHKRGVGIKSAGRAGVQDIGGASGQGQGIPVMIAGRADRAVDGCAERKYPRRRGGSGDGVSGRGGDGEGGGAGQQAGSENFDEIGAR